MSLAALLFAALAAIELGLIVTVRHMRRGFQWLITEADELPALDRQALRKFVDSSFDPDLGWVRRPDTTGTEKGQRGNITFHIDSQGSRHSSGTKWPPRVAAFGDSYVFCRQVEDEETWEAELARDLGAGVANFGVGNYGADQALLRYERTPLPDTVRLAILGFVPETICRVQSCWKHYLEFGNTFAFKPRFAIDPGGSLTLLPNPVQRAADFERLPEILPGVRAADGFYRRRFRALQFRFPYLASFARHPARHGCLVGALALRGALRMLGAAGARLEELPFTLVMAHNIREAHRLYLEAEATSLLSAILLRFKERAQARGHLPLVLVIPQLLDLRLAEEDRVPCRSYFEELGRRMNVLDLTSALSVQDTRGLYIDDRYGGHLSASGNRVVARAVAAWLRDRGELQQSGIA